MSNTVTFSLMVLKYTVFTYFQLQSIYKFEPSKVRMTYTINRASFNLCIKLICMLFILVFLLLVLLIFPHSSLMITTVSVILYIRSKLTDGNEDICVGRSTTHHRDNRACTINLQMVSQISVLVDLPPTTGTTELAQ